jgi:hypothetical protein
MSRTNHTKTRRRTGSILLAALVLVANSTVAEAHPATPGIGVPDPAGTIHTCYPNVGLPFLGGLPILGPLISSILPDDGTLRVVTPTEPCLLTLSIGPLPILALPFENGVDWPADGVLTRLVETPPSALSLTLPPGVGQIGSINVNCPAGKVAIGLARFSTTAPTAPAALVGTSRSGTPTGNTLTATFANLFAAAATISNLSALCVTLFAQ